MKNRRKNMTDNRYKYYDLEFVFEIYYKWNGVWITKRTIRFTFDDLIGDCGLPLEDGSWISWDDLQLDCSKIRVHIFDRQEEAVRIARDFHETYDRLAQEFGYETREDTKEFDEKSPNGKLMIATIKEVLSKLKRKEYDR